MGKTLVNFKDVLSSRLFEEKSKQQESLFYFDINEHSGLLG